MTWLLACEMHKVEMYVSHSRSWRPHVDEGPRRWGAGWVSWWLFGDLKLEPGLKVRRRS